MTGDTAETQAGAEKALAFFDAEGYNERAKKLKEGMSWMLGVAAAYRLGEEPGI